MYDYLNTSVTPIDLIISKYKKKDQQKIKVGFCSVFPPSPNGVAAANYFLVNRLLKRKNIEIYAIPLGGRIDKKIFPGIGYAGVGSTYLDVIVFFGLGNNLEKVIEKAKAKTIVWQTLHDTFSSGGLNKDFAELKMVKYLKKADLVLTQSKWAYDEFKRCGIPKSGYLPHSVDTRLFKNQKKHHKDYKKFTVLFVSRISYYKGIIPFLESIPYVLKDHPETIFRIHGPIEKNSRYVDEIAEAIKKTEEIYPNNLIKITEWIGYDDIKKVYEDADVLVFPSCSEGFGIPLIEAMSMDIPCIVLDKPPMNEIVVNKKTGFCIKHRKGTEKRYHGLKFPHPEDIAKKLLFFADNEKKMRVMGENGREYVIKNYEIETNIDDLIKYITETIKKKLRKEI